MIHGQRVTIEGTILESSLELIDGQWCTVVEKIGDLRVVEGPAVDEDENPVSYGSVLVPDPEP